MFAPVQVVIQRNDTNKPIKMSSESEMIRGPYSGDEADYRDLWGKKKITPKGRFYVIRDQNIILLTFEEMCPLKSVLILEYLYLFAQFSPVFVLFVIQKYHLAEIFVNIFIKSLKVIILMK